MISLYFHTIRHLKFKQIFYRIWFNITKPKIDKRLLPKLRLSKNKFCSPVKKKVSLLNKDTFSFLNKSQLFSKIGWDGRQLNISKLWLYNLHYFDDLNATGSVERKVWHNELLERWVFENKVGKGVGWESYPTSLRIVNWIKWSFLENTLSNACNQSLVFQASWINKRIEWHILGNHLFTNAKALVFAGLFFNNEESESWLKKGLKIINDELDEQILEDGGNFELSPMYHAIFLEDVLDLINISKVYSQVIQEAHINKWTKIVKKMISWLDTMTHPDGDISFFNDAALEIAPKLDELYKYAQRLGLDLNSTKFNKVTHLTDSGYIRLTSNNATVLLDVARIGPDYQPGHAHADTLSFELSLFGQRVLVNGGTSEYGISSVRNYERSTKAHNTVEINNQNSTEVWSGFRVARRAYPFDLKIEQSDQLTSISCSHDGYSRLNGKPIHKREWQFLDSSLIIKDCIKGPFSSANAYFHFHPSITIVENQNNVWNLKMSNGKECILKVKSGESVIQKSYYSPKFGSKMNTYCLKVSLSKKENSHIEISWRNINE